MTGQKEMVIQAALAFHDAWKNRSLMDTEVYDAANVLMHEVRKLIRARRKVARNAEARK